MTSSFAPPQAFGFARPAPVTRQETPASRRRVVARVSGHLGVSLSQMESVLATDRVGRGQRIPTPQPHSSRAARR